MKQFNNKIGAMGEIMAKEYLEKNGYKIIQTNYKNKIGEIDIIAYKKNLLDFGKPKTIIFIEVKTRSSRAFGMPREAVTEDKQYKIRQVATGYMLAHHIYERVGMRFDVIDIVGNELEHIENAF